mgnify:FL=1
MTAHDTQFDLNQAPLRIGRVHLNVCDLVRMSAFYEQALGLIRHSEGGGRVTLGTPDTAVLELRGDPSLAPVDPRAAGLFHTAFLLPERADLARWLAHALDMQLPLQGASDHIVSEAIYLADPEGNGVEIYTDHPITRWRGPEGQIRMATDPLDLPGLIALADGTHWTDFPRGGMIGHVHLQVGDIGQAEGFYRDILGFDLAARYPGASFFGAGGYHHQLAGNVWNSRGAGPRRAGTAGLDRVELIVNDPATRAAILARAAAAAIATDYHGDTPLLRDPWGTILTLTA